jgi:hypothetical protein
MGEGEGCGNRKSDVASLRRKLKLHLLVYIIDLVKTFSGLSRAPSLSLEFLLV